MKHENILFCDTKGVVYQGRSEGMNKYKERFAQPPAAAPWRMRCRARTFL